MADHPGLHDVVKQLVEGLPIISGAVILREVLQFGLETRHFRLHVFRAQERQREELPKKVGKKDLPLGSGSTKVMTKPEACSDLGVDALREMKPDNKKDTQTSQLPHCI
jgi:hypothetical protein